MDIFKIFGSWAIFPAEYVYAVFNAYLINAIGLKLFIDAEDSVKNFLLNGVLVALAVYGCILAYVGVVSGLVMIGGSFTGLLFFAVTGTYCQIQFCRFVYRELSLKS